MDVELLRQIDRLEKRLDALVMPELPPALETDCIKISSIDFPLMNNYVSGFSPDSDETAFDVYPYAGGLSGTTITVVVDWIQIQDGAGDVVFTCAVWAQSVGDVLILPPVANTITEVETVPGVGLEIASTTYVFTESYDPADVIAFALSRLGTDSGDTYAGAIVPIAATIKFS